MAIFDSAKRELLEILEWTDDSRDTLAWRFPDEDRAIKNGARLIVRESQVAQMVYLGELADTFPPGSHRLTTDNIPVLTRLKSWKYGFESPFKVDVYFLTTRLFTGNKWGTTNPIMMRDDDLGVVRARAFGTYDFRIVDPKLFLREVSGSDHDFRLDEFAETMRSRIVSTFSVALSACRVPILDAATRYGELGQALLPAINPFVRARYGLEVTAFVVENVSVPPEVEQAIDKRSGMAAVGDLSRFVRYQMARGLDTGGGGAAGAAAEMAMGLAVAREIVDGPKSGTAALPELLTPAEVAQALGVSEADVLAVIASGELVAKKIGASWRVKRSALDAYLAE
jgi:excisionase family DNA binding protein